MGGGELIDTFGAILLENTVVVAQLLLWLCVLTSSVGDKFLPVLKWRPDFSRANLDQILRSVDDEIKLSNQ